VSWIWSRISLDLALFWLDERKSFASSRYDFQPRSQIGFRVVAKSAGSKNLILHQWMPYSMDRSFKITVFSTEKGSRTLFKFRPIQITHGISKSLSRPFNTVPLKSYYVSPRTPYVMLHTICMPQIFQILHIIILNDGLGRVTA
jgi:hypothetical protein